MLEKCVLNGHRNTTHNYIILNIILDSSHGPTPINIILYTHTHYKIHVGLMDFTNLKYLQLGMLGINFSLVIQWFF